MHKKDHEMREHMNPFKLNIPIHKLHSKNNIHADRVEL